MTSFQDGPAAGASLMLKRAPFFLRVTVGPGADQTEHFSKIDALDQLDDEPAAAEQLFCYRLTAKPTSCHIRASKGRGGFFAIGNYVLVDPQPTDACMRDYTQWQAWVDANRAMADFLFPANEKAPQM